jgi:Zn-finger nucleic acid-binding protein
MSGYREAALSCPGCGALMEPHDVDGSIIDVCAACAGIWVDWFDGDLAQMVRGAPLARSASPRESGGAEGCPRCRSPLAGELYLGTRAEVLRCGDCAGAFVPRGATQAIAASKASSAEQPADGAWDRLVRVLRRWLGSEG